MSCLNFYYTIEFSPNYHDSVFSKYTEVTQILVGSNNFDDYESASKSALQFLKSKENFLNQKEINHKIFFEKNQFDNTQPILGEWEENEVIQIYLSNTAASNHNAIYKTRIFFTNVVDYNNYVFDSPTTLQ